MSAFNNHFTAPRTARFLRELDGPPSLPRVLQRGGSGKASLPEHRDRSTPRVTAAVAAVLSIVLVALTLWQSLVVING